MVSIIRTNSNNKDFRYLISLLDNELNFRNGIGQQEYDEYNIIDSLDTVVIACLDNQHAGCGCFKIFDAKKVEIKRMFVKPEFRGKGISKLILKELETWALEKGFSESILETGIEQHEAVSLYHKCGYDRIENYGQYYGMQNSICMKKILK